MTASTIGYNVYASGTAADRRWSSRAVWQGRGLGLSAIVVAVVAA